MNESDERTLVTPATEADQRAIEARKQLSDRISLYQSEPERFFYEILGVKKLWSKQVEILHSVRDNPLTGVPSGHNLGKSFLGGAIPWWWMLLHGSQPEMCLPEGGCSRKVIIISSSQRQALAQLGAEFHKHYTNMSMKFPPEFLQGVLGITRAPNTEGWYLTQMEYVKWFSTSADPGSAMSHATKLTGFHADHLLFIFDEAGGLPKVIWDSIQGSMSGRHRHHLAIGQPVDPTSSFAKFCRKKDSVVIRLDCEEYPDVVTGKPLLRYGPTRKWVEDMKEDPGEKSGQYAFKVKGLFPEVSDENLISHQDCNAAFNRMPDPHCLHSPAWITLGNDVARFGNDDTVAIVLCAGCNSIIDAEEHNGQDTVATTGMNINIATRWGLAADVHSRQIAIDDTGVGGGVTDQLRAAGWHFVRGINTAEKPTRETEIEKFYNLRIQLWWDCRTWLRHRACLGNLTPDAQDAIRDELTSPKYSYDGLGRIVLESKKDFKKRLGHSPDHADALVMAVYVLPRAGGPSGPQRPKEELEKKDKYWERDYGERTDSPYSSVGNVLSDW